MLAGSICALAATATTAAADMEVAVDPVPPPEPEYTEPVYTEPYYEHPVYVEDPVPSESFVATASGMASWLSRKEGLERAAHGGTVGFSFLQRKNDCPCGFQLQGVFLFGDRTSTYALSSRVMGSLPLGDRYIVPYAAVGLAVGASRVVEDGPLEMSTEKDASNASYGFAIGPSAELGVHGFLSKKLYWRAGAGFVGAGVGAITADLGVGFVVD